MSSFYNDKQKNKNDSIRIIKRNLVYMIGIDPKIAHKDILTRREYLGQYGKITKILVNNGKVYNPTNSTQGPSYSAYINYSLEQEAALAILSIDSSVYNGKQIKAAFGTTKYCAFYMKKIPCPNKECVYVHSIQDKSNIISKESSDFYIEQHKIAIKVSDIGNNKVRELLYSNRNEETIFPNPYSVYFKKNINTQLKLDGGLEKSNSYISSRDNHHISHSNYQSSGRGGYTNSSGSRGYNNNIKSKQNVNYYENDLQSNNKNNNEEIRITKTIIKEINYDNPKEIELNNNDKSKSMSLSKMLSNNESPTDKYSNNDQTNSEKELTNIDKSEGSNDIEDRYNSLSYKLDYNRSISKSRESSLKNDVYANNKESKSFNTINCKNSKNESVIITEGKESNVDIEYKNTNNMNEDYVYNTNQEETTVNNLYLNLNLNKHYSLFKLASKSKFEFVNFKPESYDLSKSHSSNAEHPNNNILGTEEITDSENQSKFLQQYYLRFTFSNLVKEQCKVSIEQDYFQKLKKSICS